MTFLDVATDASFAVATLNPATMEILQLFRGDSVIVRYVYLHLGFISATDSRSIVERNDVILVRDFRVELPSCDSNYALILVLIVMSDDAVEEGKILINKGWYSFKSL